MNLLKYKIMFLFFILLLISKSGAQNNHRFEGLLLVGHDSSIRTFDTSVRERQKITEVGCTKIDYNCSTGDLLWVDNFRPKVQILSPQRSGPSWLMQKTDNWIPTSLAIDFVTQKIYISDRGSETVSLYDTLTHKSTVIINSNLDDVMNVEVDLWEGYLFVQDDYKIIRTDLDGQNLQMIYAKYNQNSASPSSFPDHLRLFISHISVDPQTKRIYWADGMTAEVVSVNYQGQDRKVHSQIRSGRRERPFGSVTVYEGYLYWAASTEIFKINLHNKDYSRSRMKDVDRALVIKPFSCLTQNATPNPCKKNNGNCQHFCVISKNSRNNYKCVCNVGYELADDNKSCKPVQEYLIFSMNLRFRGLSITNSNKPPVDVIDPSVIDSGLSVNMDINVQDNLIYYINSFLNAEIRQVHLQSGVKTFVASNIPMASGTKLAFDWASRNIYYFGIYRSGLTSLNVLNINYLNSYKIIVEEMQNTQNTDIVVHPNKGYVYFSQIINGNSKISRITTDGLNPTVIYSVRRKHVQAITLDLERNRLYWSEISFENSENIAGRSEIHHANLDGGDLRQVSLTGNQNLNLKSIVIHGNYLYAITKDKSLIRLNKLGNSGQIVTLVRTTTSLESTLKIFSRSIQTPRSDHPCAHGHNCEKFCFAIPRGNNGITRVCGCPAGQRLATNGRSCIDAQQTKYSDWDTSRRQAAPAAK